MDNLKETFAQITDFLRSEIKTETLVGPQFTLGEFDCVPVISVGLGFGGGGGEGVGPDKSEGGGSTAGGGIGIAPVGFLVARGADIQFISTKSHSWQALFEKAPELVEKFVELKKAEKGN